MKKYVATLLLVLIISASLTAAAQETEEKGLYHYVLENGLELFIMENHAAPLAYIEIAVRAGGTAQTEKTAGLFHLYEHMMFKGNSKYTTAAGVQRAMKNLGVASWNGSTSNEYINYFFTVPSSSLTEGLEFWSYAVREPLLDENELENEKKVVISEISAYHSDPSYIFQSAVSSTIFSNEPWKQDVAGSVENILKAEVEDLLFIKNSYYIPNNAALFVGGDVEHEDVYEQVKKIYGSWPKGLNPWEHPNTASREIPETVYLVQPHPQVSAQIAQVMVYFRGPDAAVNGEDTCIADAWGSLISSPSGTFKKTMLSNSSFAIPDPGYLSIGYITSRSHGIIQSVAIMLAPEQMMAQRAAYFAQVLSEDIAQSIAENPSFFSEDEYKKLSASMNDSVIIRSEKPDTFFANLRFWWAVADTEYYFNYDSAVASASQQQIAQFASDYLLHKPALVVVLVNPELYAQQRSEYEQLGYKEITADSAFWWK